MREYDETAALRHIQQYLTSHGQSDVDGDTIVETVDAIWDAYDELGFLDADFSDDFDEQKIYEQEQQERKKVVDYVLKTIKQPKLKRQLVEMIFDAENEYEESII